MSDNQVPTIVQTKQGELAFQDYFVRQKCTPEVEGFLFQGVENAQPAPGSIEAITQADLLVICPSNPWVSIDPILAIPGIKTAMKGKLTIAVSPIIGGKAVKGPAAKMYREMGVQPSAAQVAVHYGDLLNGLIIDQEDKELIPEIERTGSGDFKVFCTDIWMKTREDRVRVAGDVIKFGQTLIKEV